MDGHVTALADMTCTLQIMKTKKIKKIQGSEAVKNSVTKEMKKKESKACIDERGSKALRNVDVFINPASLPYRQAPWLSDRRPWTQSRSSSWVSPEPPAMNAETSALSSGALPCARA